MGCEGQGKGCACMGTGMGRGNIGVRCTSYYCIEDLHLKFAAVASAAGVVPDHHYATYYYPPEGSREENLVLLPEAFRAPMQAFLPVLSLYSY